MCDRYAIYGPRSRCREQFDTDYEFDLPPRFNVAPSQMCPVVFQGAEGRHGFTFARWGLLVLLALVAHAAVADTLTGRVVAIADGDTLTLLDPASQQHRIRLMGIDAPEKAQPFGDRSKTALGALTFGKDAVAECGKRDRYGREVCKILIGGTDINLELVRAGMAWWYRKYAREQAPAEQTSYEQGEFQAKSHRQGLWADKNPVPPWEWRHNPLIRRRVR